MLKNRVRSRIKWKKYKELEARGDGFNTPDNWDILRKYEKKKSAIHIKRKKIDKGYKRSQIRNNLLIVPENLDFEKNVNNMETLVRRFESYAKISCHNTRIDLSKMNTISINSLIVMLSEIDKIHTIKKRIRYNFSNEYSYNSKYGVNKHNNKLKYLLYKIGYWQYFGIKKPYTIDTSLKDEYFLSIKSDILTHPYYVANLRDFIEEKVNFLKSNIVQEYFDDAITEAMANSVEHGYIFPTPHRKKGKWWLCGHYDKQNNYLEFTFRDYGVGLKQTLEYNSNDTIRSFFRDVKNKNKKDSEIIQLLVNDKLPKYKNKKDKVRGYGFKKFKEFAQNIGYNCEMKIISNTGKYKFLYSVSNKAEEEILEDLNFSIDGVIINWKLFL